MDEKDLQRASMPDRASFARHFLLCVLSSARSGERRPMPSGLSAFPTLRKNLMKFEVLERLSFAPDRAGLPDLIGRMNKVYT